MTKRYGLAGWVFMIAIATELLLAGHAISELLPREPLNALWRQYMLEGNSLCVGIFIEGSHVKKSEYEGIRSAHPPTGVPEDATTEPYGISVAQDGEGIFGNGGWWLQGGLLGRSTDGRLTIDLYGRAVDHILPHVWRPWWMSTPYERGYEFFVLYRRAGVPGGTVLREWVVLPSEVIIEKDPVSGDLIRKVHAALRYDSAGQQATVTITGFTHPFEEGVNLSTIRQP